MTTRTNRIGNKWTVNECLQLQREYELLGLPINEIAERHARTSRAIMFKLEREEMADYNTLYTNYNFTPNSATVETTEMLTESDEDSSSPENLKKQMMRLEKQITMLTQMMQKKTQLSLD